MSEKVGIARVNLNKGLSSEEHSLLVDLTMTLRPRSDFHKELREMGYRVGEGRSGQIDETGESGTIFSVYRLSGNQQVGEITTFLHNSED